MVREELRLYNPEYCERPHVVAINKCDLFQSPADSSQLVDRLQGLAAQLQVQSLSRGCLSQQAYPSCDPLVACCLVYLMAYA